MHIMIVTSTIDLRRLRRHKIMAGECPVRHDLQAPAGSTPTASGRSSSGGGCPLTSHDEVVDPRNMAS